jgi:hypothetical protein
MIGKAGAWEHGESETRNEGETRSECVDCRGRDQVTQVLVNNSIPRVPL